MPPRDSRIDLVLNNIPDTKRGRLPRWCRRLRAPHDFAGITYNIFAGRRERQKLHMAARDSEHDELGKAPHDDRILNGVAGFRIPAQALIPLRDCANRMPGNIHEEFLLPRPHHRQKLESREMSLNRDVQGVAFIRVLAPCGRMAMRNSDQVLNAWRADEGCIGH